MRPLHGHSRHIRASEDGSSASASTARRTRPGTATPSRSGDAAHDPAATTHAAHHAAGHKRAGKRWPVTSAGWTARPTAVVWVAPCVARHLPGDLTSGIVETLDEHGSGGMPRRARRTRRGRLAEATVRALLGAPDRRPGCWLYSWPPTPASALSRSTDLLRRRSRLARPAISPWLTRENVAGRLRLLTRPEIKESAPNFDSYT